MKIKLTSISGRQPCIEDTPQLSPTEDNNSADIFDVFGPKFESELPACAFPMTIRKYCSRYIKIRLFHSPFKFRYSTITSEIFRLKIVKLVNWFNMVQTFGPFFKNMVIPCVVHLYMVCYFLFPFFPVLFHCLYLSQF